MPRFGEGYVGYLTSVGFPGFMGWMKVGKFILL